MADSKCWNRGYKKLALNRISIRKRIKQLGKMWERGEKKSPEGVVIDNCGIVDIH